MIAIEQTVEIPASRRLVIDVPLEVPAGRTILAFIPVPAEKDRAGKPKLPRFTKEQIEEWSKSPDIQALVGAIDSTGLPPDITMKDIREMRLAEKYGV
ncbi:MAG: hypothetical protein LBG72_06775 [Spirochaetaceae bacterium]|jgi:hypothetical protein|nr:hypothetical protein [Spirochaetaceae bacterium]